MNRNLDPHTLVIPEIADLALYFGAADIVNGCGDAIDVAAQIAEYQEALRALVLRLRAGPLTRCRFVVPDFWHVAKGRAAALTAEDADRLLEAWHLGHGLGRAHLVRVYGEAAAPNRLPGAVFLSRDTMAGRTEDPA